MFGADLYMQHFYVTSAASTKCDAQEGRGAG